MSTFDETFDWVVVGSGAGSMSSGMLMRQAGKSVVVLEKTQFFGGTTAKSGGVMWIPNNQFMDPGEDSDEKAITGDQPRKAPRLCEDRAENGRLPAAPGREAGAGLEVLAGLL
jgi:succinate dehydrogenase/fumarate reductase flavoprotein subunit